MLWRVWLLRHPAGE